MARTIKYKTTCYKCGKVCDPEKEKKLTHKSFLHRDYKTKTWKAHCYDCYMKDKEIK